jgi:hypothetical protein
MLEDLQKKTCVSRRSGCIDITGCMDMLAEHHLQPLGLGAAAGDTGAQVRISHTQPDVHAKYMHRQDRERTSIFGHLHIFRSRFVQLHVYSARAASPRAGQFARNLRGRGEIPSPALPLQDLREADSGSVRLPPREKQAGNRGQIGSKWPEPTMFRLERRRAGGRDGHQDVLAAVEGDAVAPALGAIDLHLRRHQFNC